MESTELTKKYYKIKDVADLIGVPQSTLRFWEKEFPEISPGRSRHNLRYYSQSNIETIRIIHYLIKIKGLKIENAKSVLKKNRHNVSKKIEIIKKLTEVKSELQSLLDSLDLRQSRIQK